MIKKLIQVEDFWQNFCNYYFLFALFINIFGCAAITVVFLISRINHNTMDLNYIGNGITSAIHSIKAVPWMDIRILDDPLSCPKEYILVDMGAWPGTQTGCISYGSEYPNIHTGNCNPEIDSLPYENIDQIDKILLTKWKGYSFCVRFAQDYYYAQQCRDGYVQCSSGICYNKNESCPISNIFITNEDFVPDSMTTKTSISMDDNVKWLYYKKELKASPIIDIDHSFYNLPCYDKSRKPLEIQYYPLIKNFGKGCGILGLDPKSSIIDFDIEKSFYSSNNLNWFYHKLPGYINIIKNRTVFLSQQSKVKLNQSATNPTCYHLKDISFDKLSMEYFENFDFFLSLMSIFYGVFHLITALLALLSAILLYYGDDHLIIVPVIFSVLTALLDIICFFNLLNAHSKLEPFIRLLLDIQINRCFDDNIINNFFFEFSTLYVGIYYQYILSMVIFICSVFMIFPIISLLFLHCF